MAAKCIQTAVTHTVLGIIVGSFIDGALPRHVDGAPLPQLLFETLIQVGLNGAALSMLAPSLASDDPTCGIPFSFALFEGQPELSKRIARLGAVTRDQVSQVVQKTVPHVPGV